MKKKIIIVAVISIIIAIAVTFMLLNKKDDNKEETGTQTYTTQGNGQTQESTPSPETNSKKEEITMTYQEAAQKQMAMPEIGETIAIFHVKGYGDITVKFFEDVAPKAVENFVTHAKEGYYDGVTFHRVINEFMIQGGDPKGNGTGGESIWGKGFEEELSEALVPYRGSLCMASTGLGNVSLGSQFFITQANPSATMASMLRQYGYPEDLIESYMTYGGYLSLYLQYTIFGQVIDGMDIVDKIAAVETSQDKATKDRPLTPVVIESIEITEYKGE